MIGRYMVALVTPFTSQNTVDVVALKELVIRLLQDGADGFVVCGTTAEVATLSDEERDLILDTVIDVVQGRVAIWVGCGTNCTKKSLQLMKRVENKAIDGILLVVPYYNRPTQEGMFQHFSYLSEHTTKDIMIYNVPKRTGVNLENETFERLVEKCSNIVALKQSCDDFSLCLSEIVIKNKVRILCGEDGLLKECLAVGGYGIVSVSGHVCMRMIRYFVDQYQKGICLDAVDMRLKEIAHLLFMESSPSGVKYVLGKYGYIQDYVRLPMVSLKDETKNALNHYFDYPKG